MRDEGRAARLKRLRIRSWRRGTKEMDMILGPFADGCLETLAPSEVDAYDALLLENDPDLYQWYCERSPAPDRHGNILETIRRFHSRSHGSQDGAVRA
ncbi:MAG: succinate dehydrogenase assembly factor 2 [Paracoccaceae bacterium]